MTGVKAVIMAGGKGTRVSSIAPGIPKPMLPVCGKPVLAHQLACLKKNGITDIVLLTGYLHEAVEDYFGDGARFGCNIVYYTEDRPLGSGGALLKIPDLLSDDFFLINGDIIFDVDFKRFFDFHRSKKALVSLAAHPNSHPFDSSLLITDADDRVISWLGKDAERSIYKNLVNSGLHLLKKDFLKHLSINAEVVNLDNDILKPLLQTKGVFAYKTPEYIKDMGTPERYASVSNDVADGKVKRKNLVYKQKAVFLDRDGTLNQERGFIRTPDELQLVAGASEAVKRINDAGFLAIVITNQPVIARGECTLEELEHIHNKLETELGKAGAYLDDIFYCPHHPDKGFAGERPEYKINCNCRKPKPGLILEAAKKYNIELSGSVMIGDSARDEGAAVAAGCKPVLLNGITLLEAVESCLAAS